jgi:hypothetical protein
VAVDHNGIPVTMPVDAQFYQPYPYAYGSHANKLLVKDELVKDDTTATIEKRAPVPASNAGDNIPVGRDVELAAETDSVKANMPGSPKGGSFEYWELYVIFLPRYQPFLIEFQKLIEMAPPRLCNPVLNKEGKKSITADECWRRFATGKLFPCHFGLETNRHGSL